MLKGNLGRQEADMNLKGHRLLACDDIEQTAAFFNVRYLFSFAWQRRQTENIHETCGISRKTTKRNGLLSQPFERRNIKRLFVYACIYARVRRLELRKDFWLADFDG